MSQNLLIMFVKNTITGRVQNRLMPDLGSDRTLDVYIKMLEHIRKVTGRLPFNKAVFYSDHIEADDIFNSDEYDKFLQDGITVAEKLKNAFSNSFRSGYKRVVIICSDCFELSPSHVIDAFEALRDVDAVLGPTTNGGVYLLGMRKMIPVLFENENPDPENLFLDTMLLLKKNNISFQLLETLNDADTYEDIRKSNI